MSVVIFRDCILASRGTELFELGKYGFHLIGVELVLINRSHGSSKELLHMFATLGDRGILKPCIGINVSITTRIFFFLRIHKHPGSKTGTPF